MQKVAFIIPPTVELLDLAGPVQVFTEAKFYGFETDIQFYQFKASPVSTAGLGFGKVFKILKCHTWLQPLTFPLASIARTRQ